MSLFLMPICHNINKLSRYLSSTETVFILTNTLEEGIRTQKNYSYWLLMENTDKILTHLLIENILILLLNSYNIC